MKQKPTIFLREAVSSLMHHLGSLECVDVKVLSNNISYTVPEIHLTLEVLQRAAAHAAKVYAEAKFYSEHSINIGLLGQGATTYYLWRDVDKGLLQMKVGGPDEYDIMYNCFEIDIKTFSWFKASEPDTWMLIPYYQFNEHKFAYYVACQRNSLETIRILGFISLSKLESDGIDLTSSPLYEGANIGIKYLSSLTPIKKIFKLHTAGSTK